MKTLLTAILAVAGIGMILWFTSPYFRAWIYAPAAMYQCTVESGLPGEWCVGLVQVAGIKKT